MNNKTQRNSNFDNISKVLSHLIFSYYFTEYKENTFKKF